MDAQALDQFTRDGAGKRYPNLIEHYHKNADFGAILAGLLAILILGSAATGMVLGHWYRSSGTPRSNHLRR